MLEWRWFRRLGLRLRTLFRGARVERELHEEFQFYVEERTAQEIARGRPADEARRIAVRALDGIDQKKEECRDVRRTGLIEDLVRDLRYGARALARSPGFAAAAVLSLALGIGANTAIFSLIDKLLLEAVPVERPRELVLLNPEGLRNGWTAGSMTWSYQAYRGMRDAQRAFTDLIAVRTDAVNLTIDGGTRRAVAGIVSGNYFDMLGVRPFSGRMLSESDDRERGGHPVAVVTHGFWAARLGSRADLVGLTIRIGGHPFTVVGIAERGFNGLEVGASVDVFVPAAMLAQVVMYGTALDARTSYIFELYGRLKPGTSRQQAEAQLQPAYLEQLEADVAALGPRRPSGDGWRQGKLVLEDGYRGTSELRRDLATPLVALMGMTAIVLLITCANIAGLQMARAASRRKEMSIRLAIGASRRRLIRQLTTESALLAALGAAAGLLVARATIGLLVAEMGEEADRFQLTTTFLNGPVLAFAFAVSAAAAVLFGLVPALFATRTGVSSALKAAVAGETGGHMRLRRTLVTGQIALGLVLVAASGLFLRTLSNLRGTDTGFRSEHLVQFHLNPGAAGYDRARSTALFQTVLDDLGSLSGVSGTTLAVAPLLGNAMIGFAVDVEGYTATSRDGRQAAANVVAPGYFGMVGTPLLRGRDFARSDTAASRLVAIVSETFVAKFFPNGEPLGRTLTLGYGGSARFTYEIVGVARDARLNNLRDAPLRIFYLPHTQFDVLNNAIVMMRTAGDPGLLRRPVEEVLKRHDPNVPVSGYRTLDEQIDRLLQPERLVASLSLAFGVLATGLAAIGIYGVLAFSVARRTREIGVRLALGATQTRVIRLVVAEVVAIAGAGIGLGTVLALGLARSVETQLYGIRAFDTVSMAAAAGILAAVAAASAWLPARWASRVDPALTLRHE